MLAASRLVVRRFATHAAAAAHDTAAQGAVATVAHEAAEETMATASKLTWKNISLMVAVPSIVLVAFNTMQPWRMDKHEHASHDAAEPVNYGTYLGVRNKPFPWGQGDKTLFWNDHVNKLGAAADTNGADSTPKEPHAITVWLAKHMEPEDVRTERAHARLRRLKERSDQIRAEHVQTGKIMPRPNDPNKLERANVFTNGQL